MIEVGEYVRTNDGYIFKILTKKNTNYGCCGITDSNTKYTTYTYNKRSFNDIKDKIVKHSKNIIDLIQVGDIVNNGYIYEIGNTEDGHKWVHNLNGLLLFEDDIKTILTKEQYMQNCYTVERKEEC